MKKELSYYKKFIILVFLLSFLFHEVLRSQNFFGTGTSLTLYHVEIGSPNCSCSLNPIVNLSGGVGEKVTFDPDTLLYGGAPDIYQIDTLTGNLTLIFDAPFGTPEFMEGLVSVGGGIFYSMDPGEFRRFCL